MLRLLFCLFLSSGFTGKVFAAVEPYQKNVTVPIPGATPSFQKLLQLKIHEVEKIAGKKMTFGEKVRFRIARAIYQVSPRFAEGEPTPQQLKQGRLASRFGGIAILLLVIGSIVPAAGIFTLLTLPLGIAALVLGIKSAKGNANTESIIGIVTGGVVVFIWLLAVILIAALLSSL